MDFNSKTINGSALISIIPSGSAVWIKRVKGPDVAPWPYADPCLG